MIIRLAAKSKLHFSFAKISPMKCWPKVCNRIQGELGQIKMKQHKSMQCFFVLALITINVNNR